MVYLTSSGKRITNAALGVRRTAGIIRTVSLGLRRQGFLDYLWLTDYEINDPALSEPVELRKSPAACVFHQYEWNSVT